MFNSLRNNLQVVKCTRTEFQTLQHYHYIPENPVCTRGFYKCIAKPGTVGNFPDPLGVIVYAVPIGEWRARNVAVNEFFSKYPNRSHRQSAINANVTYIARIIVDPRFHRLGIGTKLIKETLPLQDYHWIETMTPPDRYLQLFLKLGFRSVVQPTPLIYIEMQHVLDRVGVSRQYWSNPEIATTYIENLNKYKSDLFNKTAKKFLKNFSGHESELRGYERIRYILSKIKYPNMYFILTREDVPLKPPKAR